MTISHNDRVDWGHGNNPPVPMWTEDQIRQAIGEVGLGLRLIHQDRIIDLLRGL